MLKTVLTKLGVIAVGVTRDMLPVELMNVQVGHLTSNSEQTL